MSFNSSEIIIEAQDLGRVFQTYKKAEGFRGSLRGFFKREHIERIALKPTNFKLYRGEIVGLVGANGAGKTTLLKLLSGLIHPSGGTASVLGFKPWERRSEFLRKVSLLLGQKNQLWWDLSAEDSFGLLAEIYDLDKVGARKQVQELAEILNCRQVLSVQLRRLSLGERMKMEIIGALLHRPQVLFLDEPTIGLDIVAQNSIREFLASYVAEFHPTVILTSHYMDDIAKLSDRLLLISKGAIVYDGSVPDFTKKSEIENHIQFSLAEPLLRKVDLGLGVYLGEGEKQFAIKTKISELPKILATITALPGLQNLKVEETDFENVIHGFLAKE